jgi:hypothetical protein
MTRKMKYTIPIRTRRSAFLRGMTRLIDPKSEMKVTLPPLGDSKTDAEAIHSDWVAVGDDIRAAISGYEKSLEQQDE